MNSLGESRLPSRKINLYHVHPHKLKLESFQFSNVTKMSSPDNDEENAQLPSNSVYEDQNDPEFDADVLEASANLRREEYESLKAIYVDDDITFKEWENRFGFSIHINQLRLEIVTGPRYPLLETPLNITVSGLSMDESVQITDSLTNLADAKLGSIMLFDLVEEARTLVQKLENPANELTKSEDHKPRFPPAQLERLVDEDAVVYMNGVTLQMISQRLQKDN